LAHTGRHGIIWGNYGEVRSFKFVVRRKGRQKWNFAGFFTTESREKHGKEKPKMIQIEVLSSWFVVLRQKISEFGKDGMARKYKMGEIGLWNLLFIAP